MLVPIINFIVTLRIFHQWWIIRHQTSWTKWNKWILSLTQVSPFNVKNHWISNSRHADFTGRRRWVIHIKYRFFFITVITKFSVSNSLTRCWLLTRVTLYKNDFMQLGRQEKYWISTLDWLINWGTSFRRKGTFSVHSWLKQIKPRLQHHRIQGFKTSSY